MMKVNGRAQLMGVGFVEGCLVLESVLDGWPEMVELIREVRCGCCAGRFARRTAVFR